MFRCSIQVGSPYSHIVLQISQKKKLPTTASSRDSKAVGLVDIRGRSAETMQRLLSIDILLVEPLSTIELLIFPHYDISWDDTYHGATMQVHFSILRIFHSQQRYGMSAFSPLL